MKKLLLIVLATLLPLAVSAYSAYIGGIYYDFYKLRQHVPSQEVIDFVNRDDEEILKHAPYWMKMPKYQPYKNS